MNVIIVTYLPLLGVCATETGMSFDRKWPDRKWPDRKWPASALYLTLHPII